MEGFDASSYGEAFADVYDDWYATVSDVAGTVAVVADLAAGGRVLELGVGTGRLALPLAAVGLDVCGVDASPSMLAALRAKPGGAGIIVVEGDFADVGSSAGVDGEFAVVLVAFNTFFNLADEAAQRRCLSGVVARLAAGGRFVMEAFVPDLDPHGPAGVLAPLTVEADRVVLQATRRDTEGQTVSGQHITITEAGIRLRPWHIRYASPDQLDEMAGAAGLRLEHRWADWARRPFDDTCDRHVSVYRKDGSPRPDGVV